MVLIILETKGENFMHLHYTLRASLFNDTMVAAHINPSAGSYARAEKTRVKRLESLKRRGRKARETAQEHKKVEYNNQTIHFHTRLASKQQRRALSFFKYNKHRGPV
jgi:hypothetical protein